MILFSAAASVITGGNAMCSIMAYCSADYDLQKFKKGFERTISRGPDDCRIVDTGNGLLGFRRLSIMGLTP